MTAMHRPRLLLPYASCQLAIFGLALFAETGIVSIIALVIPAAILNATFMVLALMPVRGYVLWVSTLCLAVASIIALAFRVTLPDILSAFNKSASIIVFITVVPAIAIPIRLGSYVEAMEDFLSGKRGAGKGFRQLRDFLMLAVMHLLMSIALNIGSIPTMKRLLDKAGLPKRYLSLVYSAGYSSYMVLSPFDGLINALILAAGTTYAGYFSRGLAMTAAIMVAACILLLRDKRVFPEGKTQTDDTDTVSEQMHAAKARAGRKIVELATHIVIMIALSALVIRFCSPVNPMMPTALVILFWSLVWTRLLGIPLKKVLGSGKAYVEALAGFRSFLPFLASAGFLGAMIAFTPLKTGLGELLLMMDGFPRYWTFQAIMLATALLSMVGVHMMISVAAISSALDPALLGLSSPGFALLLLSSWFIAMNISPFVPFSTVVAQAIGEKPGTVALRYNLPMSAMMLFIAPLVLVITG